MEELELDYEVKAYRSQGFLAPPELKKLHPLGKSPVVEIFKESSSNPEVLIESATIISTLIRLYDFDNKLSPRTKEDIEAINFYYHFSEASLQNFLVPLLVGDYVLNTAPWGLRYLTSKFVRYLNNIYYIPNLVVNLRFLEEELGKRQGKYFLGDYLIGADIMFSFPIYDCIFSDLNKIAHLTGIHTFELDYPKLLAWSKLIGSSPTHIRGYEIAKKACSLIEPKNS